MTTLQTKTRSLINPATGEPFAEVPELGAGDVDAAVTRAREAQAAWGALSVGERSTALLKWADVLEAHAEELALLESRNAGKPIKLARFSDIPFGIDNVRYFAASVRRQEGAAAGSYVGGMTSMVRREPVGVVGAITPWNYPFLMAAWKLGPALAAGNAVVIKPAPNTPLTTLRMAELAVEAGLPKGLIEVVTGGAEAGEAICTHPDIGMVSFTGSTRTGQRVMELASRLTKRVTLELGGKAPLVVFADADLEAAVQGAVAASFVNAGQDCTAATRLYVAREVYEGFLARFKEVASSIRMGDPASEETDLGPLSSAEQRDKVRGFVEDARAQGLSVELGGEVPGGPGFFYPPTVIAQAPQHADCVQEEIFGPVVVLNAFSGEEEAVALANGVRYGLAGSVWTRDVGRALRVSGAMRCGTVWVNDHLPLASEMPHGGFGRSGFGKDLSHYALEEYTVPKHVMLDHTGAQRKPWHFTIFGEADG